ncbi:transglutaminase TgpA family protein [Wenzhouxiangella sp. EGI_FJ10305]|uniref:transglutaminase TgpA family protein n=1 Tax=Wenzhouxiangella sp. EGI_FJ10305 TaxID=3243768 RepID=UPI0035E2C565
MKQADPPLPLGPVAWTIAAFLVAAAPHLLAMPPLLGAVVVLLCGWRLLAAGKGWRPPPGWLRLLLTVGAIALLAVGFGGLWGRRAATGLLCLMLAAKMLELYRLRDLRMVASVSLFLIATQFLFDESLVYIAYLFGGVLIAIGALLRIQLLELGEAIPRSGNRRIIRDAALMLLAALPVALILFVSFPRLAEPLWGLPDEVMDGKTGLSDTMSPGSIADLYIDDSAAFRAEFNATPPPPERRYWRGPVLWRFDGDTWERAFLASRTPATKVPPGPDDFLYTVQLEPHERRWLFALDYPVTTPNEARISLDFQVTRRDPVTALTEYRMRSNPGFTDMPQLPESLRRLALSLPEDRNPRTLEMARQLRERFEDDRALIDHVLDWLREEPFYYSLETAPLGRHGADEFLFDLRRGYCEYYASAFAVLMRAAGIPTRVVTGYQGGYWQEGGQYLLVRQSDAHAWVEVWLAESGWTRVDPTAAVSPARIQSGARVATGDATGLDWISSLRYRYDRLQHLWNAWVLGFDADQQQSMMRFLGLPRLSSTGMALLMVGLLGLTILLLAWAWLKRPAGSRDPVLRAWLSFIHRMRRRGLGPAIGETPLAWAKRVAPELAEGEKLHELAESYCLIRYGDHEDEKLHERFIDQSRRLPTDRVEPPSTASV